MANNYSFLNKIVPSLESLNKYELEVFSPFEFIRKKTSWTLDVSYMFHPRHHLLLRLRLCDLPDRFLKERKHLMFKTNVINILIREEVCEDHIAQSLVFRCICVFLIYELNMVFDILNFIIISTTDVKKITQEIYIKFLIVIISTHSLFPLNWSNSLYLLRSFILFLFVIMFHRSFYADDIL
jgi:hypothetical protein